VRWISDRLKEGGGASLTALLDEASRRFDLSPRDSELVIDFYRKAAGKP
jgi:hypothetical protein